MDEHYKNLSAAAAPEVDNLSSLLFSITNQPSETVVSAVVRFTAFAYWQQPTVHIASALLPNLEPHPRWKADCLKAIGSSQKRLGSYRSAILSLTTAAILFLEEGHRSSAAWCNRVASGAHRLLGEYDHAEALLSDAQIVYTDLEDHFGQARCRLDLGRLVR